MNRFESAASTFTLQRFSDAPQPGHLKTELALHDAEGMLYFCEEVSLYRLGAHRPAADAAHRQPWLLLRCLQQLNSLSRSTSSR